MNNLIGRTLGPYRIIEQIGLGGMATVYKAYQPSMDRYVAIKVLPALVSRDPAFLKRFRREAQVVAKLEHKHILPVYDYGEQEGLTYLVMRYVEAGTLKDRLVAGQLDLSTIYNIIAQVGAALDYAHRLGVIHRDVKPSNVLIDSQGDAYLTDFGLARIMESSEQLTATGVGVGTPDYMAPEQGQGLKIDHRSDIYSLGVMLYEMVTGRVPYEAETPMAVVIKHISAPLPLPSSVKPDMPQQVERVILKAMAKDPDDRFQMVAEMVTALDAAVRVAQAEAPAEIGAGELAVAREVAPPTKGFPARAMAGVREATQTGWDRTAMWAAVGVVALLAFFFGLSRVPLKVQIRGGQLEVVRVVEATITPEAAVPVTTPTETAAEATAPPASLPTVAPPVAAAPTPTSLGRIVYSDGKTGNDEIYVTNSDGSDEQRLTDHASGDWYPAWSPDGTRIVFTSDRDATHPEGYQLYLMDADGSNVTRLTTLTDRNAKSASWSPDGNRIAFHSYCALAVINADGSNWTMLMEQSEDLCVEFPTWAPDGRRIAFRNMTLPDRAPPVQHDIYVVNDDGSGLLKLATLTSEDWSQHVVWSPDGSQVAFDILVDGQERYYAVNSDGSGEPVEILSIPDSWYPWYWPQWGGETQATALARSCRIAFSEKTGTNINDIYVTDCDGSNQRWVTEGRISTGHEPAWSPDGQRLVFDENRTPEPDVAAYLYIINADGTNRTQIVAPDGPVEGDFPVWSPDGGRIAWKYGCEIMTIRPDGSDKVTVLSHRELSGAGDPEMCANRPRWSPDSQRFAFTAFPLAAHHDPTIPGPYEYRFYVVNADGTGLTELAAFQLPYPRLAGVADVDVFWLPNGRQVALEVRESERTQRYQMNADGSGEMVEIDSIPESWYPWYWPQWAGELDKAGGL